MSLDGLDFFFLIEAASFVVGSAAKKDNSSASTPPFLGGSYNFSFFRAERYLVALVKTDRVSRLPGFRLGVSSKYAFSLSELELDVRSIPREVDLER